MKIRPIVTALVTSITFTQWANAAEIHLEINNIEPLEGHVLVALYNSASAFNGDGGPVASMRVPAKADTLKQTFSDLEDGVYAIKMYHDENDNGELDSNFLGIPSEGYGFSNNPNVFGPASFEDAQFEVTQTTSVSVKMR